MALFTGHFFQPSRNLTHGFCPPRRGVCHQSDAVAHVAEVLGYRDPSENRSLTSCDWHVGSVGDEDCTIHKNLAGLRVLELREFLQDVRHLVPTLTATNIDNDVGIRPLCQLMLDN